MKLNEKIKMWRKKDRSKRLKAYYSEKQWKDAINKSNVFASKLVAKYRNVTDINPDYLAGDAISKLIEGDRKWEPGEYTLEEHLFHIICSDYSHYIDKNKKRVNINNLEHELSEHKTSDNPENIIHNQQKIDAIKNNPKIKADPEVTKIIFTMEHYGIEHHQNTELAALSDLRKKDVVNAKKRLKRYLHEMNL